MDEGNPEHDRADPPLLERIGALLFAWRNWLFTAGLIAVLIGFRPIPFMQNASADMLLNAAGLGITLLGQLIRILVIGYAPVRSGGTRKKVAAESLLTYGLFNHARNPLYVGNLLVITGLAVIHNNPWVYALALPTTLFAYVAIVAAEEAYLKERFGEEYREYCRRVPRWLPRLGGLARSLKETPFDARRVMFQEYGSLWIAVALPLALMLYEQWISPPSEAREAWLRLLGVLFGLTTGIWACLWRIKQIEVVRRRRSGA